MNVVNTLAPIFLIVMIGLLLRRTGFFSAEAFRQTNRLVYWVGLPALLLVKTAQPIESAGTAIRIFLVLLGGMIACTIAGYLIGLLLRMPGKALGAFVQGGYRGNLAYVGLPVVLFALEGASGQATAAHESLAIIAIAPLIPIYNAVGVVVLLLGHDDAADMHWWVRLRKLLVNVATNPLVLACVGGLLLATLGWRLPLSIDRTLVSVGNTSLALSLLGIGGMLTFGGMHRQALRSIIAASIKVGLAPLAGFFIGRAIGLDPPSLLVAMLFLATPTAVASYIMAEQMGSDGELAGSIVMTSTVLALPALVIILVMT